MKSQKESRMLDIKVYPACLECPCPDMKSSWSTVFNIKYGETENQFIECSHHIVCKRIEGQKRIGLSEDDDV